MKTAQIREITNGWVVIKTDNKTVYDEEFCERLVEALEVINTFWAKEIK